MLKIANPPCQPPAPARPIVVDESRLVYSPMDVAGRVAGKLLSLDELVALCHVIDHARQHGEADPVDVFDDEATYQIRSPGSPAGVQFTAGGAMRDDADTALKIVGSDATARQQFGTFGFTIDGWKLTYGNPHTIPVRR